jgi:hypothetical protein
MSQTITGGRALLYVPDITGNLVLGGVFDTVSRGKGLSTEAIHTLGQYSAREIAITAYNEVTVNCSGFRVLDHGTTVLGKFPRLQDLLNYQAVTIKVVDRESGKTLLVVTGAVPTSDNENYSARATTKTSLSYTGIAAFDESAGSTDASGKVVDSEGTGSWP